MKIDSGPCILRPLQSEDTFLLRTLFKNPFGPNTSKCPSDEGTPAI